MARAGKKIITAIIFIILLSFSASAANYTYTQRRRPVAEPHAYEIETIIDGKELEIGRFSEPADVFVSDEGKIYVADSGNNRVVILNNDLSVSSVIDAFTDTQGKSETFNKPEGVFAAKNKLYIADTGNKRIVCLTVTGEFIRVYSEPVIDLEYENKDYQPIRITVDSAERMFIISRNDNNGVIELDKEGKFINYVGTPLTQLSFMDILWNKILSQEQLDNSTQFIPIEFSSLDIDKQGFIFTTSITPDMSADRILRRINPAGYNILRDLGRFPPIGDLPATDEKGNALNSQLIDVCVDGDGIYSVLDQFRGRVFTYDHDGNLLYVFGGLGNAKGEMLMPRAIDKTVDGRFLIADMQMGRVLVFSPTEYAKSINRAVLFQKSREYEKAEAEWQSILKFSSNLDIAYVGVGKSLLRLGDYKQAMEYFKKGGDVQLYSKAMGYYRSELLDGIFPYIVLALVAVIIAFTIINIILKKRKLKRPAALSALKSPFSGGMKYSFYILTHPIDGFWCGKFEKRTNTKSACFILFSVIMTVLISGRLTGYNFNPEYGTGINILRQVLVILIPFGMWCIANWCITTLLDGKGTLKDIFIVTAYALLPFVLIQLPMIGLSNILTLNEAQVYTILNSLSFIWAGLLMFIGITVIHEYTLKKTILTIIIAIIGMIAAAFLFILFFSLIQQVINFVYVLYKELTLGT